MDPHDPTQRSIFARPDPTDEEHQAAEPALRHTPEPDPRLTLPPPRYPLRPNDEFESATVPPNRRLLIALGGGGLLILLIGGFVAASILGSDEDPVQAAVSPTPEASASGSPALPSPTAEATPTVAPSPTPSPTPAGPPQDVALGSWATVSTGELNVRAGAGTGNISSYLLVQGAVVHVLDGPNIVDGLNWYRIASLGGASGWATSGWVAEPYLTTLVEDPTLIRCGKVQRAVFDVVNGAPVPHDPIAIGDFALPAAAFSDVTLAALELMRGVDREACFTAQLDASGSPVVTAQLDVSACGRAVRDGGFFRMRPATGQGVSPEAQVKDPLIVHPSLLTSPIADDPMAANPRNVMLLIADRDNSVGCVYASVSESADEVTRSTQVNTNQCFIIYEHGIDGITIGPAAGGDSKRILTSAGSSPPFTWALNTPVPLSVNVGTWPSGPYGGPEYYSQAYVWGGYDPTCA